MSQHYRMIFLHVVFENVNFGFYGNGMVEISNVVHEGTVINKDLLFYPFGAYIPWLS